jgi:hypothetical protein
MAGSVFQIDDASTLDTILSVKKRISALNCQFPVRRQRLVYSAGPHGINPLADDDTLGNICVKRDGTAMFDVLLADVSPDKAAKLGRMVLQIIRLDLPQTLILSYR